MTNRNALRLAKALYRIRRRKGAGRRSAFWHAAHLYLTLRIERCPS